jgi:hypothetical protein
MFSFGGILGAVTGLLADGTLVPIVAVMAAATVAANLIGLTLPSSADQDPNLRAS